MNETSSHDSTVCMFSIAANSVFVCVWNLITSLEQLKQSVITKYINAQISS